MIANIVETMVETTQKTWSEGTTIQLVPLLSFFEEFLDIFQVLLSINHSINQTHATLLSALQNEAISSTLAIDASETSLHFPPTLEADQSFISLTMSVRDWLLDAEERGVPLGNNNNAARTPLNKYTKGPFPAIHYTHPTTVFNHLDLNLVGDWENLPNSKILAQPLGPDARSIDKHPHLKSILFAAIVEITNSHDISVCALRAKANLYRSPFFFLIYNITEMQAKALLDWRIWSSPSISFSTLSFNPGCPDYLFSIKNLMTMDNKTVHNMVKEVWHDQTTVTFLQSVCDNTSKSKPTTHSNASYIPWKSPDLTLNSVGMPWHQYTTPMQTAP